MLPGAENAEPMRISIVYAAVILCTALPLRGQDATEIVNRSYDQMRGETSYAKMEMNIIRPTWERTIRFKSWARGTEYSLALITHPAREEGKTFLKRGTEMWSWRPAINRMIKLPPSMMSQGWMGSDYTNDDLINEASIVDDYQHRLLGEDTVRGYACYRVELTPTPDAPVVWGRIVMWIDQEEYYELRARYFDEDDALVKTHRSSEVKEFDDRMIPSRFEIIPADESGQRTVVRILEMDFGIQLDDSFFSQQNMKRVR